MHTSRCPKITRSGTSRLQLGDTALINIAFLKIADSKTITLSTMASSNLRFVGLCARKVALWAKARKNLSLRLYFAMLKKDLGLIDTI